MFQMLREYSDVFFNINYQLIMLKFHSMIINSIAVSPNGWTDGELATKWIVEDFDCQT